MKISIKFFSLLPVLIVVLGLILPSQLTAQSLMILHSFTNDIDGACSPRGDLILSGNTLYGTTEGGGSYGQGTVFKVNTDGAGFTTLHRFPMLVNGTNSDGGDPQGVLLYRATPCMGLQ